MPEENEVTGPSSEPIQPKFTMQSATAVSGVRVGGYTFSAAFVMQGLDGFHITDHLEPTQHDWVFGAIVIGLTFLTNWLEAKKGRRLVGTPQ